MANAQALQFATLATLAILGVLTSRNTSHAQSVTMATIRYVAPSGSDPANSCQNATSPCQNIQRAVDMADPGDEIRIAGGIFSGISARDGLSQVVYLSKTVSLRGGFSSADGFTRQSVTGTPTVIDAGRLGRGLYVTGTAAPLIELLSIERGTAAGLGGANGRNSGGGMYLGGVGATISATRFFSNSAPRATPAEPSFGGAIFQNRGTVTVINSVLQENNAAQGGGIFGQLGELVVVGTSFFSNTGAAGAALAGDGMTMTLRSLRVTDNVAEFYGGGLYATSARVTLEDSDVLTNTANTSGGAVYQASGTGTFRGNRFVHNRSYDGSGVGALRFDFTSVRFFSNDVIDNFSEAGVSGISVTGREVVIDGSRFVKNESRAGGTIGLTLATFTITNIVVQDGIDPDTAIRLSQSNGRVIHSTIVNNRNAQKQPVRGIQVESPGVSTVNLSNLIVVSHSTGIHYEGSAVGSLAGVLWFANGNNQNGLLAASISGELTGNPLFAADGYHLTSVSPAINRGVATQVTTDIDGATRPVSAPPDLGADEYGVGYNDPGRIAIPLAIHRLASGW